MPHILDYNYTVPEEQINNVSELIRKEYIGSTALAKGNTEQFIQVGTNTKFEFIFGVANVAINGNVYYEL